MQTNIIRIVAAVVDTSHLTLYKESGEIITIPQGDTRVRKIIDIATPLLLQQGYADVDISVADNAYLEFETQTNGLVKLFRIAKDKLVSLIALGIASKVDTTAPVEAVSLGSIPSAPTAVSATQAAVEEIMQHAVSVASPDFHEGDVSKQGNVVEEEGHTLGRHEDAPATETIIAVVDGKVIPGMEKIKSQFTRAAKLGSTTGIENFLKRVSSVIDQRKHSVDDLLKFLERGDLPIADDGSILIYKVLANKSEGKFVDCHTRKVEQWVGAFVCMDISLVDHNRSTECSNGLHVARRGYVRNFSGDVCVLAKLAPEDVIAVPLYDSNKMRVCGYHIIAELSSEQYSMLKMNRPITEIESGKALLAKAMAGDHIHRTHEVRITKQAGEGVVVTQISPMATTEAKKEKVVLAPVEALGNVAAEELDTPVNPTDVVKTVEQLSRKEIAAKLYAEGKVAELKAYKKSAKVSWDKLGVPDPDVTPPVVKKTEPVSKVAELTEATHGEGSYKERIHKLLAIGVTSIGVAQAIRELKKKSKKSWDVLGVSAEQAEQIITLAQ